MDKKYHFFRNRHTGSSASVSHGYNQTGIVLAKNNYHPDLRAITGSHINPFTGKVETSWFETDNLVLYQVTKEEWEQVKAVHDKINKLDE